MPRVEWLKSVLVIYDRKKGSRSITGCPLYSKGLSAKSQTTSDSGVTCTYL